MSAVSIYHNPRCSKSRQTLALLEENGISPDIILYLETPPTADELTAVIAKLGLSTRDIMRTGEDAYKENALKNSDLTDEQLLAAMIKFPKLIQRPIVIKGNKAAIGRPPESVLEIL
jgi:arsenate reductase